MFRRLFSTSVTSRIKIPKLSDNGNVWVEYGLALKKRKEALKKIEKINGKIKLHKTNSKN